MTEEHPARAAGKRSMRAAENKDKEAWLAVYADDAVVEDPVGPGPYDPEGKGQRGKAALSNFWDQAIAPNTIKFDIRDSFACAQEVANVGTINLTFPNGSTAKCEGVFVYKVNDEGKVVSLRAFWEVDRLMKTVTMP